MSFARSELSSDSQESAGNLIHDRVAFAFIVLQLIGGCGLFVVILTAILGRGVTRYSTWYSFICSWIFSCISYTLLAFAGQRTGAVPDFGLCLVQGALIYAAPSLTGCTTLALVLHMFLNMRSILANKPFGTDYGTVVALLIIPHIVWLAVFLGVFVYGLENEDNVRRSPNETYCDSANPDISKISSMIVLACTVLIIVIQGIIGYRLYQNRHSISGSGQSVTMVARVMVFSILGGLALGIAVAYVMTWQHNQVFDMILATLPVLVFLIFGSQLDLLRVWTFCGNKKRRTTAEQPLISHNQYSSVSTQESF